MATDCSKLENLHEAALLVIANADLLRQWVNGDEDTDVTLGGKLTPSIRKLVAEIDARESAAAQKVIDAGTAELEALAEENRLALEAEVSRAAAEADRAAGEIAEGKAALETLAEESRLALEAEVSRAAAEADRAAGVISAGIDRINVIASAHSAQLEEQGAAIIADATAEADRAQAEADRAENIAIVTKSIIGAGQSPYVSNRVQDVDSPEGSPIPTPAYWPFAGGIHVFYEGLLLTSGIHYAETAPDAESGKSSTITILFDVETGAIWEFHVWDAGTVTDSSNAISLTTVGFDETKASDIDLAFYENSSDGMLTESQMTFFPESTAGSGNS